MGGSCPQCAECGEIPNQNGNSNEEDEKTLLEDIRKEIQEINDEGNKLVKLNYLSQYYIKQKKMR